MDVTYFYVALIIGLALSLLCEEIFGISAGGMIVPGYLALVCDDIIQILLIFAIAFLDYFIVNYLISKVIILFGRRKFVAMMIVGVVLKLIVELLFPAIFPMSASLFRGIGIITPALIANTFTKQGILYTVPAVLVVSYATFGLVTLIFWIF